jgi:D-3-phosphoglycerate dehydrogenase
MTTAISIPNSRTVAPSASPTSTSIHDRFRTNRRQDSISFDIRQPKVLHPIENDGLRLLILENISQDAVNAFKAEGYLVDHYTRAMSEDELVDKIGSYHAVGIRSKTKITQRVIKAATKVCRFPDPRHCALTKIHSDRSSLSLAAFA